jgi:hypothetical protein
MLKAPPYDRETRFDNRLVRFSNIVALGQEFSMRMIWWSYLDNSTGCTEELFSRRTNGDLSPQLAKLNGRL